jgi:ribosome-binding protein aMBF1 (putative translation factor)
MTATHRKYKDKIRADGWIWCSSCDDGRGRYHPPHKFSPTAAYCRSCMNDRSSAYQKRRGFEDAEWYAKRVQNIGAYRRRRAVRRKSEGDEHFRSCYAALKARGLSDAAIADLVGCNKDTIASWKRGRGRPLKRLLEGMSRAVLATMPRG